MRNAIAVGIALVALGGCGGSSPTGPSATLAEQFVTDHFVFRFSTGDGVDAAWQESYYTWIVAQLGVNAPRITYNKYLDRAQMGAVTGIGNTNAYADPGSPTIHTIWRTDNHETVHIYSNPWGMPVALFSEGLAVAHQMNPAANDFVAKWSGTPIHDLARRFKAQGTIVPIASLAETASFRVPDPNTTYPESGSFVRFLIDTEGIGRMRQLFGTMTTTASLSTVRSAFAAVYGYSLEEAEAKWLRSLDSGQ